MFIENTISIVKIAYVSLCQRWHIDKTITKFTIKKIINKDGYYCNARQII